MVTFFIFRAPVAHWCIAGPDRRRKNDFGYWYTPDNRSINEQVEFYKVEILPQALEKIFTESLTLEFRHSLDIFSNDLDKIKFETDQFIKQVDTKAEELKNELPKRAHLFNEELKKYG